MPPHFSKAPAWCSTCIRGPRRWPSPTPSSAGSTASSAVLRQYKGTLYVQHGAGSRPVARSQRGSAQLGPGITVAQDAAQASSAPRPFQCTALNSLGLAVQVSLDGKSRLHGTEPAGSLGGPEPCGRAVLGCGGARLRARCCSSPSSPWWWWAFPPAALGVPDGQSQCNGCVLRTSRSRPSGKCAICWRSKAPRWCTDLAPPTIVIQGTARPLAVACTNVAVTVANMPVQGSLQTISLSLKDKDLLAANSDGAGLHAPQHLLNAGGFLDAVPSLVGSSSGSLAVAASVTLYRVNLAQSVDARATTQQDVESALALQAVSSLVMQAGYGIRDANGPSASADTDFVLPANASFPDGDDGLLQAGMQSIVGAAPGTRLTGNALVWSWNDPAPRRKTRSFAQGSYRLAAHCCNSHRRHVPTQAAAGAASPGRRKPSWPAVAAPTWAAARPWARCFP